MLIVASRDGGCRRNAVRLSAQQNASSSSCVGRAAPTLGLIDVYVPSNPFNALANSIIPAVVLFSSAVGLALIGLENKQGLLAGLRVLEGAIVRITNFVIRTTRNNFLTGHFQAM